MRWWWVRQGIRINETMMTSSWYGRTFLITCPLWGESTVNRLIPLKRSVLRALMFSLITARVIIIKQCSCRWFGTTWWPCDVIVMHFAGKVRSGKSTFALRRWITPTMKHELTAVMYQLVTDYFCIQPCASVESFKNHKCVCSFVLCVHLYHFYCWKFPMDVSLRINHNAMDIFQWRLTTPTKHDQAQTVCIIITMTS